MHILPVLSWNDVLANVRLVRATNNTNVVFLIHVIVLFINWSSAWLKQQLNCHWIIVHLHCNATTFVNVNIRLRKYLTFTFTFTSGVDYIQR